MCLRDQNKCEGYLISMGLRLREHPKCEAGVRELHLLNMCLTASTLAPVRLRCRRPQTAYVCLVKLHMNYRTPGHIKY